MKTLSLTVLGFIFIVGCSADASNEAHTKPLSVDECVVMTDPSEMTACFAKLEAQEAQAIANLKAENEAFRQQKLASQARIADKTKMTDVLETEADAALERLEARILETEE